MRANYMPEGRGHSEEHIAETHARIISLQKIFAPAAEKIMAASLARRIPDSPVLGKIAQWWLKDKTNDLARNMATTWVELGDNDQDRRAACHGLLSDTIRLRSSFEITAGRDFGLNHEECLHAYTRMIEAVNAPHP